jgi:hypothetical protein
LPESSLQPSPFATTASGVETHGLINRSKAGVVFSGRLAFIQASLLRADRSSTKFRDALINRRLKRFADVSGITFGQYWRGTKDAYPGIELAMLGTGRIGCAWPDWFSGHHLAHQALRAAPREISDGFPKCCRAADPGRGADTDAADGQIEYKDLTSTLVLPVAVSEDEYRLAVFVG